MNAIIEILSTACTTPHIEDDEEYMACLSAFLQEMATKQKDQCARVLELCASKSFLLGMRTGAELERFLNQDEAG